MTPTGRTLTLLRAEGYVCCVAEAWLPHVHRRRDLFGFADVAAVHPRLSGPLLVQTTTAAHLSTRRKKVCESAAARLWLRAGGRIQLHGWERRAGRWRCRRLELHGEDLAAVDLTPRPKRRDRQRGLFDESVRPAGDAPRAAEDAAGGVSSDDRTVRPWQAGAESSTGRTTT